MKRYYFRIIFIFCLTSCTNIDVEKRQVNDFNETFNNEQLEVIELGLKSFEIFLNDNYNDKLTEKEKIIEFLRNIVDTGYYRNWKFPIEHYNDIIEKYECSGLRKEYFFYQFEDSIGERILEIIGLEEEKFNEDSLVNFNAFGVYMKALRNVSNPDSLLISYIDAKDAAGMMSYELISGGLIYAINRFDYNVELVKRILIFEFYFDLLKWNSKKEKSSAHNRVDGQ